jgi:hypothetical protein
MRVIITPPTEQPSSWWHVAVKRQKK